MTALQQPPTRPPANPDRSQFLERARVLLPRIACHEAGHAVACLARGISFPWVAVEPLPPELEWMADCPEIWIPGNFGQVMSNGPISHHEAESRWADRLICVLAGPIAEARHTGCLVQVSDTDRTQANLWISFSKLEAQKVESDCLELTCMLVDRCWPAIRAVARELIERRYLSHADVRRIFDEAAP